MNQAGRPPELERGADHVAQPVPRLCRQRRLAPQREGQLAPAMRPQLEPYPSQPPERHIDRQRLVGLCLPRRLPMAMLLLDPDRRRALRVTEKEHGREVRMETAGHRVRSGLIQHRRGN